jgi:6-phosphogluconolactonase
LHETKHRCVANRVPQLNTTRLTLTAPFINRAQNIIVMVTGPEKSQRLSEVLEGSRDPERLPIQLIEPHSGKISWLVDAGAAGMDRA